MALVFGTGLKLGALRNLEYRRLLFDRTIVATRTNNSNRQNRTILVGAWAAPKLANTYGLVRLLGSDGEPSRT